MSTKNFFKAFQQNQKLPDTDNLIADEVPECCLCRDISESYIDRPISLISYTQLSSTVQAVDKLNRRRLFQSRRTVTRLPRRLANSLFPDASGKEESSEGTETFPLDSVELTANVRHSNCGHYAHSDCFDRYLHSLLDRHRSGQLYEGRGLIDTAAGEFLCPTVYYYLFISFSLFSYSVVGYPIPCSR